MIQGMEILLERMKLRPEEFTGDYNRRQTKWDNLIDRYRHVLTDAEMKAYNDARHELERQQFTSAVVESLLDEPSPVEIDPNTYIFNTVGRDPWGSDRKQTTEIVEEAMRDQIAKVRAEQQLAAVEAFNRELKNKSMFEKIKGKKYP